MLVDLNEVQVLHIAKLCSNDLAAENCGCCLQIHAKMRDAMEGKTCPA